MVTQFATAKSGHVLLTNNEVGLYRLQVLGSVVNVVIDMNVVNVDKTLVDELQEFFVIVDEDDNELTRRCVGGTANAYLAGQCAAGVVGQLHLALRVQFVAVVDVLLGSLLGMLQSHLHVADAGNDLQHL